MELGPSHSLAVTTSTFNVAALGIRDVDPNLQSQNHIPGKGLAFFWENFLQFRAQNAQTILKHSTNRIIRQGIMPYQYQNQYQYQFFIPYPMPPKKSLKVLSYEFLTPKKTRNRGTWTPTFPSAALVFAASELYFSAASRKPKGESQQPHGSSL